MLPLKVANYDLRTPYHATPVRQVLDDAAKQPVDSSKLLTYVAFSMPVPNPNHHAGIIRATEPRHGTTPSAAARLKASSSDACCISNWAQNLSDRRKSKTLTYFLKKSPEFAAAAFAISYVSGSLLRKGLLSAARDGNKDQLRFGQMLDVTSALFWHAQDAQDFLPHICALDYGRNKTLGLPLMTATAQWVRNILLLPHGEATTVALPSDYKLSKKTNIDALVDLCEGMLPELCEWNFAEDMDRAILNPPACLALAFRPILRGAEALVGSKQAFRLRDRIFAHLDAPEKDAFWYSAARKHCGCNDINCAAVEEKSLDLSKKLLKGLMTIGFLEDQETSVVTENLSKMFSGLTL